MSGNKIGISEVAAAAGVSITTVSDALNGKGRISEKTRSRVQLAADKLGYRPNSLARSLRSNRTFLLGVVVSKYGQTPWNFTHMPFYSKTIDAAIATSLDRGYALSVLPADRDTDLILSFPFDGLLVLDPRSSDQIVHAARRHGMPVVTDRANTTELGQPWVDFDHASAVSSMCERLTKGTSRPPALLISDGNDSYTGQCRSSYERWCRNRDQLPLVVSGSNDLEETRSVVQSTLNGSRPPDAIFGIEDYHATILVEEVQRAGLQSPDDIALGCFTEATEDPPGWPPMVRLTVNPDEMGIHGIELLVDVIEGAPMREQLRLVPHALID